MDKEDVVHIDNGILPSHKKEWGNTICSNIDGPRDFHTKQSESVKDKYLIVSLTCGLLRKIQRNLFTNHK